MAGMSLTTGLISGMDTGTLITQLMQVEANPQTLLKTKLTATQADAAAYRAVNTRFDALKTAAEALTKATTWASTKASSSSSAVTATSGSSALPGSVTFTVTNLAASHVTISDEDWGATTEAFGLGSLDVFGPDGTTKKGTVTIPDGATLAEAAAAVNASSYGLTATAVQVSPGSYRLQVGAKESGAAANFSLGAAGAFDVVTTGVNATLKVGTGPGAYDVTSAGNTFSGLLPDTTITVSPASAATSVTVSVASDPAAVAGKVSALVTAANGLLSSIDSYTASDSDSATLKGDSALRGLAGQILSAVSSAVGGDGSAAAAGLQLNADGTLLFNSDVFTATLESDPALAQRLFAGTPASLGTDGATGGDDDVAAVTGIAGRLFEIGRTASDTTTGTLTLLAKSEDTLAKDLEDRIADWDLRLALRKDSLTRQFTAMETALGTLQNQSTWLTGQLAALPSWSQSSSS